MYTKRYILILSCMCSIMLGTALLRAEEKQTKRLSFSYEELNAESLMVRMKVFNDLGYDLNDNSRVVFKVSGHHMLSENVYHNDVVVVDKKMNAKNGDVVIARYNGYLVIRKFVTNGKKSFLVSKDEVINDSDFTIWGVVTHSINIIDNTEKTRNVVKR